MNTPRSPTLVPKWLTFRGLQWPHIILSKCPSIKLEIVMRQLVVAFFWKTQKDRIYIDISFFRICHQQYYLPNICSFALITHLSPQIPPQILPTCHKVSVRAALGEMTVNKLQTKQEITCHFLHTIPRTASYKLKGEVCVWSAVEFILISCSPLVSFVRFPWMFCHFKATAIWMGVYLRVWMRASNYHFGYLSAIS